MLPDEQGEAALMTDTQPRQPVALEKDLGPRPADRFLAPFRAKSRARIELESRPLALRRVYHHMTMSDDRVFLFARNSKCACTNIRQILFRYSRGRFSDRVHDEQGFRQGTAYWREFEAAIAGGETIVFTFVRHPERRVISAFRNLVLDQRHFSEHHRAPLEARGFDLKKAADENFETFLGYIEDCFVVSPEWVDRHWRLQTVNVSWDAIDYGFVGRVERFDDDMRRLFELAGKAGFLGENGDVLGARFNPSVKDSVSVTPEQRARIERLYAPDYEAFGY